MNQNGGPAESRLQQGRQLGGKEEANQKRGCIHHRAPITSIITAPITNRFRNLLLELTEAGLDLDKPLQGELAKEAGATLKEMALMKGAHCPRSMKPAGEKGRPELCGRRGGSKPASAACLHSHEPERIKDIEEDVPDNESTPAKDGAPGEGGYP